MPPSDFAALRLRGWTFILLMVFAGVGFWASAWGEESFQAGPSEQPELIRSVVEGDVEMRLSDSDEWVALDHSFEFSEGMAFRTAEGGHLGLFFQEADLIRLYPGTELEIDSVDLTTYPIQVTATLVSGSVWVSDLQGVADFRLQTTRSLIEPENASAWIDYSDSTVEVFSAHHSTRFVFLDESENALNDYLLTESHRLAVAESSISSVVGQLRYTKLVKEFPFSFVEPSLWEDSWRVALEDDQDRLRQTYQSFISVLRREGTGGPVANSWVDRIQMTWKSLRSWLVFSEDHLQSLREEEGVELIEQALYLLLDQNEMEALDRLERFNALSVDFVDLAPLRPLFSVFQSVTPTHTFYPVKELLRDLRLEASTEEDRLPLALRFMRERLNEIYDLLDEGDLEDAKTFLSAYAEQWEVLTQTYGVALAEHVQFLTEERQIIQNLLYRESVFYEVETYSVLSRLEERILTLTGEEYELNEERQTFIKDKVALLNQLIDAIDAGKVSLSEGTDLAQQLIDESEVLIQGITIQVAVVSDFFVPELNELSLKVQFLNSPDYLLGEGSLEEEFQAYLDKQDDLRELSDYLAGLQATDDSEASLTLDEAMAQVDAAFEEVGLTYLALLPLGDTDFRLFSIEEGRIGGIDFEANYDRGTGIVYRIQVEGNTFSSGVKLEDLMGALQQAVVEAPEEAESVSEESDSVSEAELSPVEFVAITLVRRTLESESGLSMEEAIITIVDLDRNLFEVEFVFEESGFVATVHMTYEAEQNVLFDVTFETEDLVASVEVEAPADLKSALLEALNPSL